MRALLILLAALSLVAGEPGEARQSGSQIAVLRLGDAFRASKVYLAAVETDKVAVAAARKKLEEISNEAKQLDGAIRALNPDNEKYLEIVGKFNLARFRLEQAEKQADAENERRRTQGIRDTWAFLRLQVKSYCQERGIMLLLQAPEPDLNQQGMQGIQLQLGLQSAIYWDAKLDITEDFVRYINERAADAKTPAPAPVTAPAPAPAPTQPAPAPGPTPAGK